MSAAPEFSLITTCKGRRAQLAASLPSWMAQRAVDFEIVVVDFDCPDGTAAWLVREWGAREGATDSERAESSVIRVVRVENRPYFNLNEARNLGLRAARGRMAWMIDSDVRLLDEGLLGQVQGAVAGGKSFLGTVPVLHGGHEAAVQFYERHYGARVNGPLLLPFYGARLGLSGTACFPRTEALGLGGYDEALSRYGYGCDDIAFYLKLLNSRIEAEMSGAEPSAWLELLERALASVGLIPEAALETEDQDELEKSRFYLNSLSESRGLTERALAAEVAAWNARLGGGRVWSALGREDWASRGAVVPRGFGFWWLYWLTVRLGESGELQRERARLLAMARGLPEFAPFFAGEGMAAAEALGNDELYRVAVIACHLGLSAAEPLFMGYAKRGGTTASARANAFYYLGELARLAGAGGNARAHFEAALRLNPGHGKARAGLAALENG